jgi:hypothetical protein
MSELEATPDPISFSAIPVGSEATQSLTLQNSGGQSLSISKIELIGVLQGESFSLVGLDTWSFPRILERGESTKLTVRYAPLGTGVSSAYIKITHDGSNSDEEGATRVRVLSTEITGILRATPNPMDFGFVKAEEGKSLTLTLENQGQAELTINTVFWERNEDGSFAIEQDLTLPKRLKPQETATMVIRYVPKSLQAEASLLFGHDAAVVPLVVRVVGQRDAPRIEVTPRALVFDDVPVGMEGDRQVTIKNIGSLPLTVSALRLGQGTAASFSLPNLPSLPLRIEPDATAQVTVRYKAQDASKDTGLLEIESDDPEAPQVTVTLQAQPSGCSLLVQPAQLLFLRSEEKSITLSNEGSGDCTIHKASFSVTTSREFDFAKAPTLPTTIKPNEVFSLAIRFTNADDKADQGMLILETDDPQRKVIEIPLMSRDPSSSPCELQAIPSTLNFGFVGAGSSRTNKVEILNVGFADCDIFQANLTVNPSQVFAVLTSLPAQGQSLPPNQRLTLELSYTPSGAPQSQGTLIILSSDQANPQLAITLLGASGQSCIEVLPSPIDLGASKVGCRGLDDTVTVINACSTPLTISGVRFNGQATDSEIRLRRAPTFPITLALGQSTEIVLAYVPADLGTDQRTLEILNSAPGQSPYLVPLVGRGVDSDEQTDTFKQIGTAKADILFVIDDSNSMQDNQTSLSNNLSAFFNWASRLQVDYHMAVTTTDADCGIPGSKYKLGSNGLCQRGDRPAIPQTGCFRGTPTVVTPATPNPVQKFSENVRVGLQGSGLEKGIEASYWALQPDRLAGCNRGFYRSDATLSIIYVSDEPDSSAESVSYYVNFFRSLKGARGFDMVRASSVVGPSPGGCQPRNGTFVKAAPRYWEIAQTMGGVAASICDENWSNTLNALGASTFGLRTEFFLSRPADPATIVVRVDGKQIPSGAATWQFNASSNSIRFASDAAPLAGVTLVVTYKAICLTP